MTNEITKDLDHLAVNTALQEGLEVVAMKLHTEIKPMTIEIQISRKDGKEISLDDCANFSGQIGNSIDSNNLLKDSYVLEISSPGLNDILKTDKEFETFKGFPIEVSIQNTTASPILYKNGLLHTRSEEYLLINVKGKMSKIPRENIIQVRLATPTG